MPDLPKPGKGLVATVVTTGSVRPEYTASLMEMRSQMERTGIRDVEWKPFSATFVNKGRDDVVRHALANDYEWVLQIDADAVFPPETFDALWATMHTTGADMAGAYSQLKGFPHRPTIDTGTGTWENVNANQGVVEVIRTGGHCFLHTTDICRRVSTTGPWFMPRQPIEPLAALRELDNFCRIHFDGENPLWTPAWEEVARLASEDAQQNPQPKYWVVGEDSAWCDLVRSVGGRIVVNTDVVTGHVTSKVIGPKDFTGAIDESHRLQLASLGIL